MANAASPWCTILLCYKALLVVSAGGELRTSQALLASTSPLLSRCTNTPLSYSPTLLLPLNSNVFNNVQQCSAALQHYTRLLRCSAQAVLRLHHAGAVLLLPDFSMDSVMAMARYAMTGEVEQLVTLGKILELPGMVQEVGGGRESWRHNESPRRSRHPTVGL